MYTFMSYNTIVSVVSGYYIVPTGLVGLSVILAVFSETFENVLASASKGI